MPDNHTPADPRARLREIVTHLRELQAKGTQGRWQVKQTTVSFSVADSVGRQIASLFFSNIPAAMDQPNAARIVANNEAIPALLDLAEVVLGIECDTCDTNRLVNLAHAEDPTIVLRDWPCPACAPTTALIEKVVKQLEERLCLRV